MASQNGQDARLRDKGLTRIIPKSVPASKRPAATNPEWMASQNGQDARRREGEREGVYLLLLRSESRLRLSIV